MGLVHRILDILHGETSTPTQKIKVLDFEDKNKSTTGNKATAQATNKSTVKSKETGIVSDQKLAVSKENKVVPNAEKVAKGIQSNVDGIVGKEKSKLMEVEEPKTVECLSCKIISYSVFIVLPTYCCYYIFKQRKKYKLTRKDLGFLAFGFTGMWSMIGLMYVCKVGIFRPMYEGETVWEYYKNTYRDDMIKFGNLDFQGMLKYDPPPPKEDCQEETKTA